MKRKMKAGPALLPSLCICIMALALFFGCDGNIQPELPTMVPQSSMFTVESVRMDEPETRGIITSADFQVNGSRIGVYALNSDNTEYHPAYSDGNYAVYQYDGTKSIWLTASDNGNKSLRLPSGSNTLNIYAYYPSTLTPVYQSGGKSYVSGVNVLAKDNFTADGQTDYLYSPNPATGINVSNPSAGFTLKHALAKVTFRIYKSSSLTKEMKLTRLQIISSNNALQVGDSKTMGLKEGTLQGLVGRDTITLADNGSTNTYVIAGKTGSTSESSTASPYCLLAPAPSTEYLSFQLATSSASATEQKFLTPQIKMGAIAGSGVYPRWTAGQHFIFTIVLDGMKAYVSGIRVCKWEDYTDTYIPVS